VAARAKIGDASAVFTHDPGFKLVTIKDNAMLANLFRKLFFNSRL